MNEVQQLLNIATEHEGAAREARKAAGRLLATIRERAPSHADWLGSVYDMGLDVRTATMLLEAAAGGREVVQ
jgi:hypothetical protein